MGDRKRCEFECTQALLAGKEVVIDRFACTHHTLLTARVHICSRAMHSSASKNQHHICCMTLQV